MTTTKPRPDTRPAYTPTPTAQLLAPLFSIWCPTEPDAQGAEMYPTIAETLAEYDAEMRREGTHLYHHGDTFHVAQPYEHAVAQLAYQRALEQGLTHEQALAVLAVPLAALEATLAEFIPEEHAVPTGPVAVFTYAAEQDASVPGRWHAMPPRAGTHGTDEVLA